MPTTLALNPITLDLDLTHPGGTLLSGLQAIAQAVAITLRTAKREWWLDASFGLDYHNLWLVKAPNVQLLAADVRTQLLRLQGVRAVTRAEFDLDAASRHLSVTLEVETTEGRLTATASDVPLGAGLFVLHFSSPYGPLFVDGGLAP